MGLSEFGKKKRFQGMSKVEGETHTKAMGAGCGGGEKCDGAGLVKSSTLDVRVSPSMDG